MTKRYRLRVWCPDCLGDDPQGCFDGQFADLEPDEEYHDTVVQAEEEGYKWIDDSIYEFDVIDTETGVVMDKVL